jgi:hypothetical protein
MIDLLKTVREDLEYHSMKLAAAAAAVVSFLTYNFDALFGLLSFVPVEPMPRFLLAVAMFMITYFGPRIARFWPQPKIDTKEAANGDAAA